MTDREMAPEAGDVATVTIPLDPTGAPGLDEVLGGGIQRGSLAIIAGPPGSGKTILAHQIAFAAARAGRRTVVLTAFSEPTNKLLAHMRPFAFFDQDLLGQTLEVFSAQQFLRDGLLAATEGIIAALRAARAELVILDGFRGVREMSTSPDEERHFIYELSNRLNLLGVTLLLTSEAHVRDMAFFPEATSADVLVGLEFEILGTRERRTLEVLKVRGTAPLPGRHTLSLSDVGMRVYPRLEAQVARQASAGGAPGAGGLDLAAGAGERAQMEAGNTPLASGIPGLDALIGGGLAQGSASLVTGGRGAGKTLLGLQFALQGAAPGASSVFVSFRETEEQLRRLGAPFRWGEALERALATGTLTVARALPVELRADIFAAELLALLDARQAQRLVVDGIDALERMLYASEFDRRLPDYLAALVETLRVRGVASLLTFLADAETRANLSERLGPAAGCVENLMWLRRDACGERDLTVCASGRPAALDGRRPFTIREPEGVVVGSQARDPDQGGEQ
ncbi:MAG TPA: ATPase domain-containing protein [Ktedonobacterales bacterium]